MATADDARLLQLAAEPEDDLFPILNRAAPLTPLVTALAFLPGLFAIRFDSLNDEAAAWGLKALSILTADTFQEVLDLPSHPVADELASYAPLGSWITALAMLVVGAAQPLSLLLCSYLASAGLIITSFVMCRRLAAFRPAFLFALLLAFHPEVLRLGHSPAPHALSVMLAVLSFLCLRKHLDTVHSLISLPLLGGGIAMAACLLACGPATIVIAGIMGVYTIGLSGRTHIGGGWFKRVTVWRGLFGLLSLIVMCFTAFAAGGWWELMMGAWHGSNFWTGWLAGGMRGLPEGETANVGDNVLFAAERLVALLGLMTGLSMYGFGRACLLMFQASAGGDRPWQWLPVAWFTGGLPFWYSALNMQGGLVGIDDFWGLFMLWPLLMFAADTLHEIAKRHISLLQLAGILWATVLVVIWQVSRAHAPGESHPSLLLWTVVAVIILFSSVVIMSGRYLTDHEIRGRLVARGCLIIITVASCLAGFLAVRNAARYEAEIAAGRPLELFASSIAATGHVSQLTLATSDPVPAQLQFTLQRLWPQTPVKVVNRWERPAGTPRKPVRPADAGVELVITWGMRPIPLVSSAGDTSEFEPLGSPQYFQGRMLSAYQRAAD